MNSVSASHPCAIGRLFACAAWLFACGEGVEPAQPAAGGGAMGAPACDARVDVFPVVCATAICHDGSVNGVDLISPGVDERVLDVPAAGVDCGTSGLRLVDSREPDRSLLLLKLTETPPCGSPMPLGSGPSGLTEEQRDCVDAFVRGLGAR